MIGGLGAKQGLCNAGVAKGTRWGKSVAQHSHLDRHEIGHVARMICLEQRLTAPSPSDPAMAIEFRWVNLPRLSQPPAPNLQRAPIHHPRRAIPLNPQHCFSNKLLY